MDTNPTNLLISSSPLEGLTAWVFNPLPIVGSRTTPLHLTPKSVDHAGKFGCKSQNYTSWDCSSRSYLSCITSLTKKASRDRRETRTEQIDQLAPDTPTEAEKQEWNSVDIEMWNSGKKKFYRSVGLLTKKQIAQTKYQKMILARCAHEETEGDHASSSGHHNLRHSRATNETHITDFYAVDRALLKYEKGNIILYSEKHDDALTDSPYHKSFMSYILKPYSSKSKKEKQERGWPDIITQAQINQKMLAMVAGRDPKTYVSDSRGFWMVQRPKPEDIITPTTSVGAATIVASQLSTALASSGASSTVVGTGKHEGTEEEDSLDEELEQKITRKLTSSADNEVDEDEDDETGTDGGSHSTPDHLKLSRWKRAVKKPIPDPNYEFEAFRPSDTMPIRVVGVSNWRSEYEMNLPVPYSPIYTSILQRLQDPAATGALGSMARGPSIRDATSYISLAKAIAKSPSSVFEIAPLLRLGCIITALSSYNYSTEIIYHRFIRRWTTDTYIGPYIAHKNEPWTLSGYDFLAMPLDIFVSFMLNKYGRDDCNDDFVYNGVDSDWTAIPVRSELLGENTIIPYLASFLSSELWNGRVNHRTRGFWTDPMNPKTREPHVQSIMPASISTSIPGPKKFIIVLVDYSAGYPPATINVGGIVVPVWRGTQPILNQDIPDFADAWQDFFTNENIERVRTSCVSAFNEVENKLAVENAGLIANSLIAELYLANYQGMAVKTYDTMPSYNWGQPAYGAWTYLNPGPICEGSRLRGEGFITNGADTAKPRRRIVGYNFSAVSAFMRPPSGIVKTITYHDDDHDNTRGALTFWANPTPEHGVAGYNVTTMDSLMRVSTYIDLILTSEKTQLFTSWGGFASWHHMLAMALTFQTTVMFAQSNINLAVWTGYDTRYDSAFSGFNISRLIKGVFQGFVNYTNISELIINWHEWDEDTIMEYYGIDPFNNSRWMSHSAVPYHAAVQWIQKMKSSVGEMPKNNSYFRHRGNNHMAIQINPATGEYRMHVACTIDADRYFPVVVFRDEEATYSHMPAWVDQFAYISCVSSDSGYVLNCSYLESQSLVLTPLTNGLEYTPVQNMFVVNSDYLNAPEQFGTTKVSEIQYPDPISLSDIISGAKNYVLDPILSAIMGFVRGGPVGAVMAGGSTLAQKIIDANTSGNTKEALNQARMEITESAHKANTRILHGRDTHASEMRHKFPSTGPEPKIDLSQTKVLPVPLEEETDKDLLKNPPLEGDQKV